MTGKLNPIGVLIFATAMLVSLSAWSKTVRYDLTVTRATVNLSGKANVDWALVVNGTIPAPTLEFTEGDDAEIQVTNGLEGEEVSIHWHGILLPPEEDGVAYVNTPPIFPGKSRIFRFPIRQHGTYWYHSHTMVQEQKGVYGPLIIHPRREAIGVDRDVTVVLSDWSDENADQILKNLRKDGDYYQFQKDSMRSIGGALLKHSLGNMFSNEWQRMKGMDLSDVGYDAFLINGKAESQLTEASPGERVRLRIINAGASSYFYVSLAGLPMKVVSADGLDITPFETKELLMGMAETYDVVFTVPGKKRYELRATAQDVTGFASGWIGSKENGDEVRAPDKEKPDLYAAMNHGSPDGMGHMQHGGHHSGMHHSVKPGDVLESAGVDDLQALEPTTLPATAPVMELKLVLDGSMERYTWNINGKAIHEDRNILVNEGDVVRFIFENRTMMHHPMHLHGHFFRVLNQFGDRSPLKHTVDVPPHGTRTIEFYANEPGQWMLHCHNLYHMKSGMARVVKYMSYAPSPQMEAHSKHDPHLHDHLYVTGKVEAATNHAKGEIKIFRTRDEIDLTVESRSETEKYIEVSDEWDLEGDLLARRWFGKWFNVSAGGSLYHEKGYGIVGVGYVWPLLFETSVFVNHEGRFRVDVERRFQWTKSIFSDAELSWRPNWHDGKINDIEWEVSLMYGPSWHWAAGFKFTNENLGAGVQVKF